MTESAFPSSRPFTRRSVPFFACALCIASSPLVPAETHPMPLVQQDFGKLARDAPHELSAFAFLIGSFQCNARIKTANGDWQRFEAQWLGRYILDGHAIADEYRMTTLSGDLAVLGMNFRTYDAA